MGERKKAIEVSGLVKRYDDLVALGGVSLVVNRGEVFGLLGSNGAGKTTMIHVLTGILTPTEGTARVAGVDVVRDPLEVKRRIGYLPETPALYDRLTGMEYLQLIAGLRGMDPRSIDGRIGRFSENLDMTRHLHLRMGAYSKGMKQKISFMAAVFHRPDILFLDEPTSGLDPRYSEYMKDFIRGYSKKGGTVFLSTHYTSFAQNVCTRVAVIHRGGVVGRGTVEDMLAKSGTVDLAHAFIELTGGPIHTGDRG